MNKLILSAASFSVALLITSCTTTIKTATSADVNSSIITYPEVADMDVQEKVTQSLTWNFRPFHIGEPKKSTAKGNLIAETLQKHQADILLQPQFTYTRTAYGERVLTVTGYPAVYKNFRKATASDLEAIKACNHPNAKIKYNGGTTGLFGVFKK